MFGINPRCLNDLCTWGEAGVIETGRVSRTGEVSVTMMFVGGKST